MSYYRLYLFGESGSIRNVMDMECASDEAALELARTARHPGRWELWNRDRLVRRHDPAPTAPQAE